MSGASAEDSAGFFFLFSIHRGILSVLKKGLKSHDRNKAEVRREGISKT